MSETPDLVVWHGPNTRSTGTVWLVEELGAPYELRIVDVFAGETRSDAYMEINPAGKVPAIRHRGRTIAELAAISLYLADAFPEAGLAPAIGDPDRGAYLYWSVFRPGVLEPAALAKVQGWEADPGRVGWGDFETALSLVERPLSRGPYLLGERFSAADILVGGALGWLRHFGVLPPEGPFNAYIDRLHARPAYARMQATNA